MKHNCAKQHLKLTTTIQFEPMAHFLNSNNFAMDSKKAFMETKSNAHFDILRKCMDVNFPSPGSFL